MIFFFFLEHQEKKIFSSNKWIIFLYERKQRAKIFKNTKISVKILLNYYIVILIYIGYPDFCDIIL